MTWFTFFTGLAVFTIGIASKFLVRLDEWQALLPIVGGLAYLTWSEGMRSMPARKRFFQFLSILWSMFVIAVTLPVARQVFLAWNNEPVKLDDVHVRPELVLEYASVCAVCLLYFFVALIVFFRQAK